MTHKMTSLFLGIILVLSLSSIAFAMPSSTSDSDNSGDESEGYAVQITAPDNVEIQVYNTQTVSGDADVIIEAGTTGTVYARDTEGQIDISGSGQVNFVVIPDEGYEVDEVTATGSYKNLKGPDDTGTENAYRITKITAADVVVNISVEVSEGSGDDSGSTTENFFTDVSTGAYYYNAVLWAVNNDVTLGTSSTSFSPSNACTRSQIVTFLWRASGSPDPTITNCTFTDINRDDYYYKAVLWAVENNITAGTSDTTFSPNITCTRAQAVSFLYRYSGNPAITATGWSFTDINSSAYYYEAVLWAAETGVTAGTTATTFSPNAICSRAQIVTLLYRAITGNDTTGPTFFTFSDSGITVSGNSDNSYSINGTSLTISGSGIYSVSGSCSDGSITIKKGTTGVTLILNGLTLTSADTAPITCNKSTAAIIVAASGTVNTLTDSTYNNDETYSENTNAENAVIKCKDGSQITLCGSGTINVNANGKNGIKGGATTDTEGEAQLTVKELTLNITANVNDGLKSDQELNILSGKITISAADDGIKSDLALNIGANGTTGPTIKITKSNEGIEAAALNIYSGSVTVNANDDGINAANSDLTGYNFALNVYGGTVYVNAANGDGIDSNGSLTIKGGTVTIFSSSKNDNSPLDCDGKFTLSGGTVLAVGSGGMAQTPNNASQCYLSFGANTMGGGFGGQNRTISIATGNSIAIQDTSGNRLYSSTAVRSASYVFFSSSALIKGQTYTLQVNGKSAATAAAAG